MQSVNASRIAQIEDAPELTGRATLPGQCVQFTHDRAMSLAQNLKNNHIALFEILLIVERDKVYYQFDVPSLFIYCVELLELSPSVANDFINVTRKSLVVPELAGAVREGRVTISKARKICSVLTPETHREWIALAESCSTRIIEKAVALENPREAVKESMKYLTGDILEFKLAVSENWQELLVKTKDLLSQKHRRAVHSEEALEILMSSFVKKEDPIAKAERALSKRKPPVQTIIEKSGAEKFNTRKIDRDEGRVHKVSYDSEAIRSRYRRRLVEHEVTLRDQNRCTYIDSRGKRCESQRWLEKHHINEFSKGGEHSLDNLETLCSGHHKIKHLKAQRNQLVT